MKRTLLALVAACALTVLGCGGTPAGAGGGTGGAAGSGGSGGGGGTIPVGNPCNLADDQCVVDSVCTDYVLAGSPVCTATCADNASCNSGDVCYALSFLTGGSETARICDLAVTEGNACDAAAAYCDASAGLSCLDAGDGVGPVCRRTCDPAGAWTECEPDACVPDDYFAGTFLSAIGICTPFVTDSATSCELGWNICGDTGGGATTCVDLVGDGSFTCVETCSQDNDCLSATATCHDLVQINPGLDPRLRVCIEQLAPGTPCDPAADLCPEFYGCHGNITIGWECRQEIDVNRGRGMCTTLPITGPVYGIPCDTNDSNACSGNPNDCVLTTCRPATASAGAPCDPTDPAACISKATDCVMACPQIDTGAGFIPQLPSGSGGAGYCVAEDFCDPFVLADCPAAPAETCIAVPLDGSPYSLLAFTCVPAGTAAVGDVCDATTRCVDGAICIPDLSRERGICAQQCDADPNSNTSWPADCGAQSTDATPLDTCAGTECCIDASCIVTNLEPSYSGVYGTMMPDYGTGCSYTGGDCAPATDEVCLPHLGAWARSECVTASGTALAGEPCQLDGTGADGCAGDHICAPLGGSAPQCIEMCDPTGGSGNTCAQGAWENQPNCFDPSMFGGSTAPPPNTFGICVPFCMDTTTSSDCALGQTCLDRGWGGPAMCSEQCNAGGDSTAECLFGEVCLPEPVTGVFVGPGSDPLAFAGTGTCGASAWGGVDMCDVVGDCTASANNANCVPAGGLPAGGSPKVGFCALYVGAFETSCNPGSGARCPTGDSCYQTPSGDTFCAPADQGGTPCADVSACAPSGEICVNVAATSGGGTPGYCAPACRYEPLTFPDPYPGGNCPEPGMACYHSPGGPQDDGIGYCAHPDYIPGAPASHCDPGAGGVPCVDRVGFPATCIDLGSTTHEPTTHPDGLCVARCDVGATASPAACGGDPGACVADGASVPGLCIRRRPERPVCELFTQAGCDPFETCGVDQQPVPPGGVMSVCKGGAGTARAGAPCNTGSGGIDDACDVGLDCVPLSTGGAACTKYCDPAVGASCGTGEICVDASLGFFTDAGHLGGCAVDDGCDPVARSGCGFGDTCLPVGFVAPAASIGHAHQCVTTSGTLFPGDICGGPDNGGCGPGLLCARDILVPSTGAPLGICTPMCDPGSGGTPCAAMPTTSSCVDVSASFNASASTYGVCIPD